MLEVLAGVRRMFNVSEPRYLLNRIYVDDFCMFVEKVDKEAIMSVEK